MNRATIVAFLLLASSVLAEDQYPSVPFKPKARDRVVVKVYFDSRVKLTADVVELYKAALKDRDIIFETGDVQAERFENQARIYGLDRLPATMIWIRKTYGATNKYVFVRGAAPAAKIVEEVDRLIPRVEAEGNAEQVNRNRQSFEAEAAASK